MLGRQKLQTKQTLYVYDCGNSSNPALNGLTANYLT